MLVIKPPPEKLVGLLPSRSISFAFTLTKPGSPEPRVALTIIPPFVIVNCWVETVLIPAFPSPKLSAAIALIITGLTEEIPSTKIDSEAFILGASQMCKNIICHCERNEMQRSPLCVSVG